MNRLSNKILLLGLALLMATPLFAQYEKMGGVYYAYPVTETEFRAAPEGYQLFYISHTGGMGRAG